MQKDCRNNPCQRFGSALNLNVHCHLLVPDGAYTFEHDKPHFHRAPAPSPAELRQLLDTLIARITRTLVRGGELIEEPEHPYLDLELNSPLHQLSAAAVRYRIAVGPQAGRKTMTLRNPGAMVDEATSSKPFTAARDGFSINAAVGCEAHERGKLERLQPNYIIFRTRTVAFDGDDHARGASLAWRNRGRVAYPWRQSGVRRA